MRYLWKVFQFEPLNQNQPREIDVQDIDHLGLIAGIVDEIGIVEIIEHYHYENCYKWQIGNGK